MPAASRLALDPRGTLEPHFVKVFDTEMAYRRDGEGETVLYLHGMGLSASWLNSHIELAQRVDLLAPQLPGFGRTRRPAWFRSLDDHLPYIVDLLDALGLDRVHLVGHSLGGEIAAAVAAAYPERWLSLTLVAPLALPVATSAEVAGDHEGEAPPNLMSMLFNEDAAEFAEYDPPEELGLNIAPSDDELADPEAFRLDVAHGTYRRLARFRGPAQIILPDRDQVVPTSVGHDYAKWLTNAEVVTISGDKSPTGHMLNMQRPVQYAEQIAGFVNSAAAKSAG